MHVVPKKDTAFQQSDMTLFSYDSNYINKYLHLELSCIILFFFFFRIDLCSYYLSQLVDNNKHEERKQLVRTIHHKVFQTTDLPIRTDRVGGRGLLTYINHNLTLIDSSIHHNNIHNTKLQMARINTNKHKACSINRLINICELHATHIQLISNQNQLVCTVIVVAPHMTKVFDIGHIHKLIHTNTLNTVTNCIANYATQQNH